MPTRRLAGCAFCGRPDKLTLEHVWPKWLQNVVTYEKRQSLKRWHTTSTRPHEKTKDQHWREFDGTAFEQTAKRVCDSCNRGWMHDLENAARPWLEPMIRGDRCYLDAEAQAIVATWAVKTAIMLDFTGQGKRAFAPADRRWLYDHRTPFERIPPPGHLVFLAAYDGFRTAFYQHLAFLFDSPHLRSLDPGEYNAHGATFSVGHLALQVVGIAIEEGMTFTSRTRARTGAVENVALRHRRFLAAADGLR